MAHTYSGSVVRFFSNTPDALLLRFDNQSPCSYGITLPDGRSLVCLSPEDTESDLIDLISSLAPEFVVHPEHSPPESNGSLNTAM